MYLSARSTGVDKTIRSQTLSATTKLPPNLLRLSTDWKWNGFEVQGSDKRRKSTLCSVLYLLAGSFYSPDHHKPPMGIGAHWQLRRPSTRKKNPYVWSMLCYVSGWMRHVLYGKHFFVGFDGWTYILPILHRIRGIIHATGILLSYEPFVCGPPYCVTQICLMFMHFDCIRKIANNTVCTVKK